MLLSDEWEKEVQIRGALEWTQTWLSPHLTSASKPNTPACVGFYRSATTSAVCTHHWARPPAGPSIKPRLLHLSRVHLWMKCWGLKWNTRLCKNASWTLIHKGLIRVFYVTAKSHLAFMYLDLFKKYIWMIKPKQKQYSWYFKWYQLYHRYCCACLDCRHCVLWQVR